MEMKAPESNRNFIGIVRGEVAPAAP